MQTSNFDANPGDGGVEDEDAGLEVKEAAVIWAPDRV
jgi:hypothetical protein